MPKYAFGLYNPPAPIAYVTLRNFEKTAEVSNVPMLLDTGADATLLPYSFVEKLGIDLTKGKIYELEGFDESKSHSRVIRLQMIFEERSFQGEFLTINQNHGIIGRNVLNSLKIIFDGQNLQWVIL